MSFMPMVPWIAVILLSIVGLFSSVRINPQDVNCFGLEDKDCRIWSTAAANLSQLTSFNYDYETTTEFKFNMGSTQTSNTSSDKGGGVLAIDLAAIRNTADQLAVLQSVRMTLDESDSSTFTTISPSRTATMSETGSGRLVLVDGILYRNTAPPFGWLGEKVSDPYIDPAVKVFLQEPAVLSAISTAATIEGAVKLSRTANTPVLEGQRQIEFVYSFDLRTLLDSREMEPVMRGLLNADLITAMSSMFNFASSPGLASSLNSATLKITCWVGSQDNLYHAVIGDFALQDNLKAFESTGQGSVSADVHFALRLTKIGQPVSVEVPEDVQMLDMLPGIAVPSETPMPTLMPSDRPTTTPIPAATLPITNTPTATVPLTLTPLPTDTRAQMSAATNTPMSLTETPTASQTPLGVEAASLLFPQIATGTGRPM
jgi:hypothetical protein